MLNFLSSCLATPKVLDRAEGNISTWVNPGYFKRKEVSRVGTSSTLWKCAHSILTSPLLPKRFFQLDLLFCSSYTATVSLRGQMAAFVIFTLHPQRGVRAITRPPPKIVELIRDILRM